MLPKSYQEVEYLESTGVEYIDTGIRTVSGLNTFDLECAYLNSTNPYGNMFGGDNNGDSITAMTAFFPQSNKTQFSWVSVRQSNILVVDWAPTLGQKIRLYNVRNGDSVTFYHDGVSVGSFTLSNIRSVTYPEGSSIALFGRQRNSELRLGGIGRVYSFKWYEDSNLEQSLVPCYRKYDEKPGMYDTVRGVFLTNQGSGEFVTGPPVYQPMYRQTHPYEMGRRRKALISKANKVLPSGYQRVQYLENVSNAWLNPGIQYQNNLRIVDDIMFIDDYDNPESSTPDRHESGFGASSGSSTFLWGITKNAGAEQHTLDVSVHPDWKHLIQPDIPYLNTRIKFDLSNTGDILINDVLYGTGAYRSVSNANIYLFAGYAQWKNSDKKASFYCHQRRYYTKFFVNDSLVSSLIPCYRKSDGKPGMYDIVRCYFLINQGSSGVDFVLGPNV